MTSWKPNESTVFMECYWIYSANLYTTTGDQPVGLWKTQHERFGQQPSNSSFFGGVQKWMDARVRLQWYSGAIWLVKLSTFVAHGLIPTIELGGSSHESQVGYRL